MASPVERRSAEHLEQEMPGAFPASEGLSPTAFSSQQSLSRAVFLRRGEYTRPKTIRIKVGTWNVASKKGTEKDLGGWFVDGKGVEESLAGLDISAKDQDKRESVEAQESRSSRHGTTIPKSDTGTIPGRKDIGLYVLGLQEVMDVTSITEAVRPYTDPATAEKYKSSLEAALPPGYELVAEQQLIGLLLLVYASPSVFPDVKSVSTTSVGTGVMGYMGNKGAVTARIVLGETTRLVFINCHLGAGAEKGSLERRNWDAAQIVQRTKFEPITDSMDLSQSTGEKIGDEDFAFWFGDLNYRLEGIPGDDVRRLLMLHTRDQYDISRGTGAKIHRELNGHMPDLHRLGINNHSHSSLDSVPVDEVSTETDPAALQTTLSSLLPHDELQQQMQTRKAFHDGWKEAPIQFLPTYKYDVGSVGAFDSSDKRRGPSWCDRILYRTRSAMQEYSRKAQEKATAKIRDEEMKKRGMEEAADDESVLYEYNPEEDGDDYDETADAQPEVVTTREGFEDEITQEYYAAHQRVLSSDHKPLDAVFIFKYDAIVADLKAKVHAEVARELDRAENETRPTITVVVDRSTHAISGRDSPDESSNDCVHFGRLHFDQHKHRHITIANTGQVPASVCFIDRLGANGEAEGPVPVWLSLAFDRPPDGKDKGKNKNKEPVTYTLEPGDTCTVTVTARVEAMELVKRLNDNQITLDDILILRVIGGRDHFVPVSGKFVQSGLDKSIDKLMQIPEHGIRRWQNQKPDGSGSSSGSGKIGWSSILSP